MRTYTGVQFFPMDPRPEEIVIEDIAHALSMQCRFGGHCQQFYSVAQHSVRVSHAMDRVHGYREVHGLATAALLHDAAEAYLVDVPRPVKVELREYAGMEDRLMKVIAQKFGFQWPLPPEVHELDDDQLWAEMRDLFPTDPRWSNLPKPRETERIYCLSQRAAELRFLERFTELTGLPVVKP